MKNEFKSALDQLIAETHMQVVMTTDEIVEKALYLQTQLPSLGAMDSMQLGAAAVHQCDVFITNDKRLTPINQFQIITLDQWK